MGILQHEGQALRGIGRIQRHIRAAGFQNAEKTDDHLRAALHANGHRHLRPDAQGLQVMGQLIGAGVELSVGQLLSLKHDGHVVRRALDLFLEQLMEALVLGVIGPRIVELDQQLPAFSVGQNFQVTDRGGRIADDTFQQRVKMSRHPVDRGCIKHVGVETNGDRKRSGRLDDQHDQIQGRGPAFQRDQLHRKPAMTHPQPGLALHECRHGLFGDPVRFIQDEHGLAERWSAEIPGRPESLDQAQGGVILMLERRQHRLTHLAQKRPKGWVAGKVRTQDDRIGEEAHHPFKLGPAPPDHGGSHEDVFLAAVVVKQQLERRQQDHEQRRPLGSGERPEPSGPGHRSE